MSPFDKVHTMFYSSLIETMHLSCTILELFAQSRRFLPTCIWYSRCDDCIQISLRPLASENLSPWAIVWCC